MTTVRVLAVDDRRENLLALQAILEGLPIEVVPVTNGEDALKQLLVKDYALFHADEFHAELFHAAEFHAALSTVGPPAWTSDPSDLNGDPEPSEYARPWFASVSASLPDTVSNAASLAVAAPSMSLARRLM